MGIGGAETHVLSLALAMSARGHRVAVVAERGELCEKLKMAGVRFIRVPLSSTDVRSISSSYKIMRRILLRWDFDVVHVHSRLSALIVSEIRRREGLSFRFIVTAHARYKTTRALRYLSVWGDRCIVVSRDIKSHLIQNYGVDKEKITVIPNGIDTDRFHPVHKGKCHSILFVSRLDKDCSRGAKLLCGIAPELSRRFPDVSITVAGEGNDYEKILALAEKSNKRIGRKCVSLVGKCTDMPELMSRHSLVVGVSRVALEAMAMEKPVVLFGNEGALGLFDEKKLPVAVNTNFTCRGFGGAGGEFVLREIEKAFTMDSGAKKRLCALEGRVAREKYSIDRAVDMTLSVYGARKSKRLNVLIGGYYGFGNLGDESVLSVLVGELRRNLPECRIRVLTHKGLPVRGAVGVDRGSPLEIMRAMRKSDVYISGGGSLFQNRTSNRSLAYYCELINMAKAAGCRCVVLANGIGPLKGRWAERMTASALCRADHISVRDMESFLRVISLCRGEVSPRLSADPAFLHPVTPISCGGVLKGVRYAAVALNGSRYNRDLVLAVKAFCQRRRLLPAFVPMDTKIDARACERAASECGGVAVSAPDISAVVGILRSAEIAIGERLHFLIFALKSHTPLIPISADPKIDAFSFEVFGEGAVEGKGAQELLEKMERFMTNTRGIPDKSTVKDMADRARRDIDAAIKICLSEKCSKGVEKK